MRFQTPPQPFAASAIEIDVNPLVSAIARERAVVFVGAGASIPAQLPSWSEFLRSSLNRAIASSPRPQVWDLTKNLLDIQGDHLMAAELLQKGLGSQLEQYIWDDFAWASEPSIIHHAISRLPFSLAITTNYDRLLETAYRNKPSVTTWRSPLAVFNAIKNGRFAVVKTHGDVGDGPSLVLTKTQYRDLIHLNEAFNSCFRTLLCYRTFLFVGSSLRDHDLLELMDEARLTFGQDFGPHYAILFEDQVDEHFLRFLQESYSIHPIICRPDAGTTFTTEMRTRSVVSVLRSLAGQVAVKQLTNAGSIRLDGPLFCLPDACATVLKEALRLTGSIDGKVCLIRSEHFQALYTTAEALNGNIASVKRALIEDSPISHTGVIGSLFLRAGHARDFVYISDVSEPFCSRTLKQQNLYGAKYLICDSRVNSELACAIYAAGQKVGVINVESDLHGAYSADHLSVLQSLADQVGSVYLEAKQRRAASRGLSRYFHDFSKFSSVMDMSRFLKRLRMRYILWEIDSDLGKFTAHWDVNLKDMPKSNDYSYNFEEKSLVGSVAQTCARAVVPDVDLDLIKPDTRLAKRGCQDFLIKGPLTAMPIQCGGNLAAVLVAWSSDPASQVELRKHPSEFEFAAERIFRIAHLIANAPMQDSDEVPFRATSRAKKFIKRINELLSPIDKQKDWTLKMLKSSSFRKKIIRALMTVLLDSSVGIGRIRLWRWIRSAHKIIHGEQSFECIASISSPSYLFPGTPHEDAYCGVHTTSVDPFCHYTMARFHDDPYARHQDRGMFGVVDANNTQLHKDPDGSWIVGPIVSRSRLLFGFLSADNHKPTLVHGHCEPVEIAASEKQRAFQRAAIDVITHMLSPIMIHEVLAQNRSAVALPP